MSLAKDSLILHRIKQGKISVESKVSIKSKKDLCLAYTPGVAEPCKAIAANPDEVYTYTAKGNMVAVVTDGSAVLGLGNIGPEAALPVMEGKAVLFKEFAGVDAFPICLNTQDVDEIVAAVECLEPAFGGINLEDIAAPRCFEIEKRLKNTLSIPIFHDDQHGTAIVVLAAVINALKAADKDLSEADILINGDGAAGTAIASLLLSIGVGDVVVCGKEGALCRKTKGLNPAQKALSEMTNQKGKEGSLSKVISGSDVFIGVSAPGVLTKKMVKAMSDKPVVLAMANPEPEIWPEEAKEGGAYVVGTGRSDFPNQVNNVLAFPGVFRGALDVRAARINEEMKIAAAYAIAELIEEKKLTPEYIIPDVFDDKVASSVAFSVAKAAKDSKVARLDIDPKVVRQNIQSRKRRR